MSKSKYFSEKELSCRCGCGDSEMDPGFLGFLDALREKVGRQLILASAKRCPAHNKKVGGSKFSAHLTGMAGDIVARTSKDRNDILNAAYELGCRRRGVGKRFIHVDIATSETGHAQDVVWVY